MWLGISALLDFPLILTRKHLTTMTVVMTTMTIIKFYIIKTLPNTQFHSTNSPSLPICSEDLIVIDCSTPVTRIISPCFCNRNFVIAVMLHDGFYFLLFVAHATYIGMQALLIYFPLFLLQGAAAVHLLQILCKSPPG